MKFLILNIFIWMHVMAGFAQRADQILGKWQNPDKDRQIEIYKKGKYYEAKIIWVKQTGRFNVKEGDVIIQELVFKDKKWNGVLKVPSKDVTFDTVIIMKDINTIDIRAKFGLISQTKTWTRLI